MDISAHVLQANWHVLLGWASIVAGIAIAVHALVFDRPRPGIAHILRSYRPADWSAHQSAHERVRPMDSMSQLQRLTDIAERGFAQIEAVADLHLRAAQELEAVDDGLVRLLAIHDPSALPPPRQHEVVPAPAPLAEPLAA
jgi:hypothetical protein